MRGAERTLDQARAREGGCHRTPHPRSRGRAPGGLNLGAGPLRVQTTTAAGQQGTWVSALGFDLAGWVEPFGYLQFKTRPGELVQIGDWEISWSISRRGDVYTTDFRSRGSRSGLASASDVGGALRVVMLEIGQGHRRARRLPRLEATVPAGVDLEEGPTAFHLRWSGGWIDVRRGFHADHLARLLAASVQGSPDQVRESLEAPTGAPLFTVGG